MKELKETIDRTLSRKTFLKGTAAAAGGALVSSTLPVGASAWVGGSDRIKVALIGTGARGAGAVERALSTDRPIELVALCDIFRHQIDTYYDRLMQIESIRDKINVPEANKLVGLDAYKEAIELADVVFLATPPAFRPLHFKAAIDAGKHVFMEKALATDSPGVRTILEVGKQAEEKGLNVVVGLQNRFSVAYQELVKRVHDGMIGRVVSANTDYLIGHITERERLPGQTELEYQLHNWRYFYWLWGGSPAGLNIHYSDIIHWVKGGWPVQVHAVGGRGSYNRPGQGNVYDTFGIEFIYEDGTKSYSQIRTINGCHRNSAFYLQGTKGTASIREGIRDLDGNLIWRHRDIDDPDPYLVELNLLFDSIRNGGYVNHADRGARSTLTCLMGRMSAHSGQIVTWDEAMNSEVTLVPELHSFDDEAPVQPNPDGSYPVPRPGETISV